MSDARTSELMSRRNMLAVGAVGSAALAAVEAGSASAKTGSLGSSARLTNDAITTRDGTTLYYKDWGTGPAVVFSHGYPLSADAWENQMMFLMQHGYRVRSTRFRSFEPT